MQGQMSRHGLISLAIIAQNWVVIHQPDWFGHYRYHGKGVKTSVLIEKLVLTSSTWQDSRSKTATTSAFWAAIMDGQAGIWLHRKWLMATCYF